MLLLLLVQRCLSDGPSVVLPVGSVVGRYTAHSREFLGIPYARVDQRWNPPTDINSLPSSPFLADQFGACCPQIDVGLAIPFQSEDCLNLNVFAPLTMPSQPVPVMIWIHGGGGTTGCSAQSVPALYNGTNLIALSPAPVIVVTINYRLNALGLLFLKEMKTGNLYVQDVLSALRWIQLCIGAMGGDPSRVTVFGESAGGNMALEIPVIPSAKGLLSGVIAESSTQGVSTGWQNVTEGQRISSAFAQSLGCSNLTCLRNVSLEILLNASGLTQFGSIVDGTIFPQYPTRAYREGNFLPLSFATLGWNEPDNFPLCTQAPEADSNMATQYLTQQIPLWTGASESNISLLLSIYNVSTCLPRSQSTFACCDTAALALREAVFICNGYRILSAMERQIPESQYWYSMTCCPECPLPSPSFQCVCQHTSEIAYVFGTTSNYQSNQSATCTWSPSELSFSKSLIHEWVNLAAQGAPSSSWTAFSAEDTSVFAVRSQGSWQSQSWNAQSRCELWREIDDMQANEKFGPAIPASLSWLRQFQ